jgi:hypothetical protein
VCLFFVFSDGDANNPQAHSWTSEQRVQLLRAMAPLSHPHLTGLAFGIAGFELGQPEVAAIQHSFGAGLTTLVLGICTLLPTFWVAMTELLPHVTDLQLRSFVKCHTPDVIIFCSRRSTAQPLTLHLSTKLYEACGGAQLQASLRANRAGHVSIVEVSE